MIARKSCSSCFGPFSRSQCVASDVWTAVFTRTTLPANGSQPNTTTHATRRAERLTIFGHWPRSFPMNWGPLAERPQAAFLSEHFVLIAFGIGDAVGTGKQEVPLAKLGARFPCRAQSTREAITELPLRSAGADHRVQAPLSGARNLCSGSAVINLNTKINVGPGLLQVFHHLESLLTNGGNCPLCHQR